MTRMSDTEIFWLQASGSEPAKKLAEELLRERALTQELMETVLALGLYRDNPAMVNQQIERAVTLIHLHNLE